MPAQPPFMDFPDNTGNVGGAIPPFVLKQSLEENTGENTENIVHLLCAAVCFMQKLWKNQIHILLNDVFL